MIPQKILRAGPESVAEYLWKLTPLGQFFAQPVVSKILAQNDAIEGQLLAHIYTPDFLGSESYLVDAWQKDRPDQFRVADGLVSEMEPLYDGKVDRLVWEARRLLRLAACRKLDASLTGYEGFEACPFLAGNPSTDVINRELKLRIKVGTVATAVYGKNKDVIGIPPALLNPKAVKFVERALLPFVPEEEDTVTWSVNYRLWRGLEDVRAFETGCKLPLFPGQLNETSPLIFDLGSPPEGYVERFAASELVPFSIGYEELVQLGLTPYLAAPLDKYLGEHPNLAAQYFDNDAGRKYLFKRIANTLTTPLAAVA